MAQAPTGGQAVRFKMRGGAVQDGTLVGTDATGVKIKVAEREVTLPTSVFELFQMVPPPEYGAGYQAYAAGEFPKALTLIKSVTDRYKGLPTDWAQYATGILGDIYVASADYPKAEAAYNEFEKLYKVAGGSSPASEVGRARIAVAKKDFATAKTKLEPIVAAALAEKTIPAEKRLAYSQAFLVSGQLKEQEGNLPGALEDYLRTVTLFYHDPSAVAAAQQKADDLRGRDKDHPVTVP